MPEPSTLLHEIEQAIASGTAQHRMKALDQVTEMFIAGSGTYSDAQIAVFDDVLQRLAVVIELEARAKLARRVATLEDAPPNLIRSLALDDAIAIARPVLVASLRLADADLIAAAETKTQAHLHAISRRAALSEAITDVLIDRGDRRVVRSVVKNGGARISDKGYGKLVTRAGNDDTLAVSLGMRRDIPRHHFVKLLQTASAAVRARLVKADPAAADAIRTAVAEVAGRIGGEVRESSREFARAKKATKRRYATRQLSEGDIHTAASGQNFEKVVAALTLLGRIPVELVERALVDPNPSLVLILARAATCSRATAKALLRMRVADRGMSAHDIERAVAGFDRLGVATARRLVDYYVSRSNPGAGTDWLRATASSAARA